MEAFSPEILQKKQSVERIYFIQYKRFKEILGELNRDFGSFRRQKMASKSFKEDGRRSSKELIQRLKEVDKFVEENHPFFRQYLDSDDFPRIYAMQGYLNDALNFAMEVYNVLFQKKDNRLKNMMFGTKVVQTASVAVGSVVADMVAPGSGGMLYSYYATGINGIAGQLTEHIRVGKKMDWEEIGFDANLSLATSILGNRFFHGSIFPAKSALNVTNKKISERIVTKIITETPKELILLPVEKLIKDIRHSLLH